MIEQNKEVFYLKENGYLYMGGIPEADAEWDNWNEVSSPHIFYDAIVRAFGADHLIAIMAAHLKAEAHCASGAFIEARRLYKDIELRERNTIEIGNPRTMRGIAAACRGLGDVGHAESYLKSAEKSEILEREIFPDS